MGKGKFARPNLQILNTYNLHTLKRLHSFQMLGLDGSLVFLVNFLLFVIFHLTTVTLHSYSYVVLFCRNTFFGWYLSTHSSSWSLVSRNCLNKLFGNESYRITIFLSLI